MTTRRVALLLIAGLLVIAFAIWLSSKRHLDRATLAGDLVLPGLESAVNSVTEVRLSKGDGTRTTLRRGAAEWTVVERSYPADSGKVRKLLLDLAALNIVEEKTRNPDNYPQLGVEAVNSPKATGTRVDAVTPARTYSLIVGKTSSPKSGFVRVPEAQQSLLAGPSVAIDADPPRWLDHTLIDIPQDRIKEVDVKPAEGAPYTATRASKEQSDLSVTGIPKGRELSNPAAADSIAGSLAGLALDDVRSAAQTPAATGVGHVTFRTFNGLELEFAGHKDGTRTFVSITPRSSDKDSQAEAQTLETRVKGWEFEIPGYKYDAMFRPLEDVLKKLPEKPAAKDGAKPKGAGTVQRKRADAAPTGAPEPSR